MIWPNPQTLRAGVIYLILLGVAGACVSIVVYDEINGKTVDSTVQGILAFVIGVLSNQLGNQQGGQQTQETFRQALNGTIHAAVPPGSTIYTPAQTSTVTTPVSAQTPQTTQGGTTT